MNRIAFCTLSIVLAGSAFATEYSRHLLYIDKGAYADPSSEETLDAIFQGIDNDHLVIYCHGGLIARSTFEEGALPILYANYSEQADVYPLFIVWNSGLTDTWENILRNKLVDTGADLERLTEHARTYMRWLADFVRNRMESGVKAQGFDVESLDPQAPSDDEVDAELRNALQQIPDSAFEGEEKLFSPAAVSAEGFRESFALARSVTRRIKANRDHGSVRLTILEELLHALDLSPVAKATWDNMKENTQRPFESGGAGEDLIAHVDQFLRSGPSKKVTLIGHSAGAIFMTNLIGYADQHMAPEHRFRVVLLAPAVTYEHFASHANSFDARVSDLRVFGMNNTNELKDKLLGEVYNASLLYFVGGVCEDTDWDHDKPLLGMERYFTDTKTYSGKIADVKQGIDVVRTLEQDDDHGPVWSDSGAAAPLGYRSTSRSHGGFDDEDAPTQESVIHYLKSPGS